MPPLHRHKLVHLYGGCWTDVRASAADKASEEYFARWAAHDHPLVVTRQPDDACEDAVGVGLPVPLPSGRKLRLVVPIAGIAIVGDFPAARGIGDLLPSSIRPGWIALVDRLSGLLRSARVFGSYGWQTLTGLPYVHERSDIDLLLEVDDAASADAVTEVLTAAPFGEPRLDGELAFPNGAATAWKEWHRWRAGRADRILVKRVREVCLESGRSWLPGG
jgi:phosphoribosyl-dephospho-CoA transferase